MAMAMVPEEAIFVQTDPAFIVVLEALKELKDQNRLITTSCRMTYLENIESNNPSDEERFIFGGERAANEYMRQQAFARTASSVLRMCMLEATNVTQNLWPQIGKYSHKRNKAPGKLITRDFKNGNFRLADNKSDARKYWSRYDKLYPHFLIEHEIHAVKIDEHISLQRMMIIFRGNFTEVIEITTKFEATQRDARCLFDSVVRVVCIVYSIVKEDNEENQDGPKPNTHGLKLLKYLLKPVSIDKSVFFEILKNFDETEKDLPDALDYLQINEEPGAVAVVPKKEEAEEEEEEEEGEDEEEEDDEEEEEEEEDDDDDDEEEEEEEEEEEDDGDDDDDDDDEEEEEEEEEDDDDDEEEEEEEEDDDEEEEEDDNDDEEEEEEEEEEGGGGGGGEEEENNAEQKE